MRSCDAASRMMVSYYPCCQIGVPGAAWAPPVMTPSVGCGGSGNGMSSAQASQRIRTRISNGSLEIIMPDGLCAREFRIRDATGKLVSNSARLTSTGAVIDLNGLTSGLYAVEVVSGSTHRVERFIYSASR